MVQAERILVLNDEAIQDRSFVLYWMQAAQRAEYNHALEHAIHQANRRQKPVIAAFSITDDFPEANQRHYAFMLEGLKETQAALAQRDIQLVILHGKPEETIPALARKADLVVTDEGYLRIQKQWRETIAEAVDCTLLEVTTNLIVPIEVVTEKENYSAGTLRPRIHRQLEKYLIPLRHTQPRHASLQLKFKSFNIDDTAQTLEKLSLDRSVQPSAFFKGGASQAQKRLRQFIQTKLKDYAEKRNDPMEECQSDLSPYLHFGQISPLFVALQISKTHAAGNDSFLEELIVRRELSHNFVYYNSRYDDYDALPAWALRTLNYHAADEREYVYSKQQFETAQTHDPYWNAAQMEMVLTGKMHNYMRMYWGKKILEWSRHPKTAFETALYLNNKYELDGRDPNAFAGVAWCFGKHDRAWSERAVFGKVRYMNASGLKRKFNPDAYAARIQRLQERNS